MEYILHTTNYRVFDLVDSTTYKIVDATIPRPTFEAVSAAKALPGDIVTADENGKFRVVEHVKPPPLVGFFDVCSKTIYGMSSRGVSQFLFHPLNAAYPPMIVGYSGKRDSNKLAVVRFERWDTADAFPRSSLEQVLGNAGEYDTELTALIRSACPWRDVKEIGTPANGIYQSDRLHITAANNWRTFNIDPHGCKDIDDVFSYRPLELNRATTWDDIYEVAISIADVAAIIEEGSALDLAACERGETLYVDGTAQRPMLPATFSEDICSIRKGTLRPCVSLVFEFNATCGTIKYSRFVKAIVENNETYTYDDIRDLRDVSIIRDVASAIDASTPADSHDWIQTLMIFYNKEVAKLLVKHRRGLLRTQAAGEAWRGTSLVEKIPELKYMAMNGAKYTAAAADGQHTHAGIGDAAYCHASSPIRRYADLVNQRQLKSILFGEMSSNAVDFVEFHLNKRGKEIKKFNRDVHFLNVLYESIDGKLLTGVCIGTNEAGDAIKVYITEWKKIIKIYNYDGAVMGDWLSISYWFNPGQLRWKDRIVFRVEGLIEAQIE